MKTRPFSETSHFSQTRKNNACPPPAWTCGWDCGKWRCPDNITYCRVMWLLLLAWEGREWWDDSCQLEKGWHRKMLIWSASVSNKNGRRSENLLVLVWLRNCFPHYTAVHTWSLSAFWLVRQWPKRALQGPTSLTTVNIHARAHTHTHVRVHTHTHTHIHIHTHTHTGFKRKKFSSFKIAVFEYFACLKIKTSQKWRLHPPLCSHILSS